MKNLTKIIALSLCLAILAFAVVACEGEKKDYDDYEDPMTNKSDDDSDFVTAPPDGSENEGHIGEAPDNDELGWGPIIPR